MTHFRGSRLIPAMSCINSFSESVFSIGIHLLSYHKQAQKNLKGVFLVYKMLGLLKEQVEHSGSVNISASLKEARSRVANYDASNN